MSLMDRKLVVASLIGLSGIGWFSGTMLRGDDAAPKPRTVLMPADSKVREVKPVDAPADSESDAVPLDDSDALNVPRQPADEPLRPLVPAKPRSEADQKRLDAIARFMAGELLLERNKIPEGLAELQKSIDLYPAAIDAYRLYIPAAVREGRTADARKYALIATRHAPEGVQLLRALVAVLIQGNEIPEAIALLQEGVKLEDLKEGSFESLILQRHLAQCYQIENRDEEAAATYTELLKELRASDPKLNDIERRQLFGDKGALYDEMGTAFLAAKLPEQAVEAFEEGAKFNDGTPGIHGYNLATVFRQKGQTERALEELDKYLAAQLSDKGRAPYQLLKELLAELKRSDELLPRLKEMQERDRRNRYLAYFLADEYLAADQIDEARKLYEQTNGGTAPESLVGLSLIARREGDFKKWLDVAGRTFATLQLANPGVLTKLSPELQELVKRFTTDLEELAKSKEQMDSLVAVAGKAAEGTDPELEFDAAWLVGRVAVEAGRSDDAAKFYRYAIDMQNVPPFQLFRELGAHFIEAEKYGEAESTFQDAADHPSLEPARSFFLSLVSVARELDGRIDEAVEAIAEARRLTPKEPQFAIQEARIYYRARRWDKAVAVFEEMLKAYPQNEDVQDWQFSLSAIYVQKGDFERGEKILLDILEKDPDQVQANNDLGYLWADRNVNLDRAEAMIRKALAAEPENAAYLDSMGWVLFRRGKYDEAATHLEKAASLPRGEDATIFDHLGDCLEKLGKKEQAIENWKKALQIEEEKSVPDPKMLGELKRKLPTMPEGKK